MNYLVYLSLGIFCGASAIADTSTVISSPISDAQIADILKTANESEIKAAKLAQTRTTNESIKDFAQQMIDEHTANLKNAKTVTKDAKIKAESNPVSTDLKKESNAEFGDLKKLNGTAFDKAYVANQVKAHQDLLDDLDKKFIPYTQNNSFKDFLKETREHVSDHLKHAQSLEASISK